MSETQKQAVLARCGELLPQVGTKAINETWDIGRGRYNSIPTFGLFREVGTSKIDYKFDERTPESDPVWPLAAQILGIKPKLLGMDNPYVTTDYAEKLSQLPDELRKAYIEGDWAGKTEPRPSNELLRRAWDAGKDRVFDGNFERWLKCLKPDPLQADREYVKVGLPIMLQVCRRAGIKEDFLERIKRLAGMEVQGG